MQYNIDIQHRPGAAVAVCRLQPGQSIRAESDAMVSMAGQINVATEGTRASGGLWKSMKRTMLGGESFFTNLFTATTPSELCLAPSLPGDMIVHQLDSSHELFIQGSSYVAAGDNILLDTKFQGMKGFISGQSLFFLHAKGEGPVIVNAFGGIDHVDIDGEYIVDTGHVVAFTSGLNYQVTKASSGWIASFLSGEGFVLRLKGRGRLYLQTRNPTAFGQHVGGQLPPR